MQWNSYNINTSHLQNDLFPLGGSKVHNIPLDGREVRIYLPEEGVPQNAYEIEIYAYTRIGNLDGVDKDGSFIFSTITQNGKIERSLFFHAYDQNAWSFNSENIALPVDAERILYAKIDRPLNRNNFYATVKVVGYRKPTW